MTNPVPILDTQDGEIESTVRELESLLVAINFRVDTARSVLINLRRWFGWVDRAARIDELKSMLAEEFSMYLMDNETPPGSYLRTSIEHRIAELEADGG